MRTLLLSVAGALIALYVLGGALLFIKQRDFLYPIDLISRRVGAPPPPFRAVDIATPDGEKLRAWHAPGRDGFATILHLHGNGDTLEGLAPRLLALAGLGHGVLAVAFRGYPGSSGKPTETGLTADAFAAYDWLIANGVAENRIAPHGRSLGSGLAVKLAAARNPGALMLEAGYTSIAAVAQRHYPIYPAGLMLLDPYRSIDLMAKVRAPLLLVHGGADGLIPPSMARELHDRASSSVKKITIVPAGGHDNLDAFGLLAMIDAFLREAIKP